MAKNVILQPGEHGLAGPSLMIVTKSQSEGRIYAEKLRIMATCITGGYLILICIQGDTIRYTQRLK